MTKRRNFSDKFKATVALEALRGDKELLPSLVFEAFGSCCDLVCFGGFYSVGELDACDDFGEIVKAA